MSDARQRLAEAQVAVMFLTRLPAGRLPAKVPTLAEAAWAFPLAGLVVGGISGAVFLATSALPPLASALLALTASALLTGALHEDGLSDVADGFGGGRDRMRKLEVMRDSRIGSYGAVALVLCLGLIASGMAEAGRIGLFLAIGAGTRAVLPALLAVLPPAREDGLGRSATLSAGWRVWAGLGIALVVALFGQALLPLLAAWIAAGAAGLLALRQIGGQTGDVMGAAQKAGEAAGWLTAAALLA